MDDAEVALTAALAAGRVARQRFRGALRRVDKAGIDFATDADIDAEQAILDVIATHRPDDRITAEESGASGNPNAVRCWLIDPICGTLNYAAGTGPVGINVALVERDSITVAAVVDPLTSDAYWSDHTGAWRHCEGGDTRLKPTAASRLVDLNVDAPTAARRSLTTLALIADPQFAERFGLRVVSTSLALAWVSSGQRAAYVSDGDVTSSVHFAAGIGLCQHAGCVVTDLNGEPFTSKASGLVAAADEDTHTAIVSAINRLTFET